MYLPTYSSIKIPHKWRGTRFSFSFYLIILRITRKRLDFFLLKYNVPNLTSEKSWVVSDFID